MPVGSDGSQVTAEKPSLILTGLPDVTWEKGWLASFRGKGHLQGFIARDGVSGE